MRTSEPVAVDPTLDVAVGDVRIDHEAFDVPARHHEVNEKFGRCCLGRRGKDVGAARSAKARSDVASLLDCVRTTRNYNVSPRLGNKLRGQFPLTELYPAGKGDLAIRDNGRVALQRMDNVGIVVESLDAAISFFAELGLELEGRAMIEGDWSGRVTGLRDQRVEIAMMRMPDGHGKIELSRFLTPPPVADHRNAPVNALGYLRVMFAVDDLDDTLARLREHGAQLVDEVVQYEDVYRLCYVRGPEGILIGLAEQIG